MLLKKKPLTILMAVLFALPLTMFGATTATASSDNATMTNEVPELTPKTLKEAKEQLEDNGYAYDVVSDHYVYELEDGVKVALPAEAEESSAVVPYLGGGVLPDSSGVYLDLNNVDQRALLAGGSGVLSGAICLAAPALCPIVGGVVAAAVVYVDNYGLCPGTLRVEADWNGALKDGYCL